MHHILKQYIQRNLLYISDVYFSIFWHSHICCASDVNLRQMSTVQWDVTINIIARDDLHSKITIYGNFTWLSRHLMQINIWRTTYIYKRIFLVIISYITSLCYNCELEFIAWTVASKTIFQLILRIQFY